MEELKKIICDENASAFIQWSLHNTEEIPTSWITWEWFRSTILRNRKLSDEVRQINPRHLAAMLSEFDHWPLHPHFNVCQSDLLYYFRVYVKACFDEDLPYSIELQDDGGLIIISKTNKFNSTGHCLTGSLGKSLYVIHSNLHSMPLQKKHRATYYLQILQYH